MIKLLNSNGVEIPFELTHFPDGTKTLDKNLSKEGAVKRLRQIEYFKKYKEQGKLKK